MSVETDTVRRSRASSRGPSVLARGFSFGGALAAGLVVVGLTLLLDWTRAEMLVAGAIATVVYTAVATPILFRSQL